MFREPKPSDLRAVFIIVPLIVVAYAGAAIVRYGLIEREDLGAMCLGTGPPWYCGVRLAIVRAFLGGWFGYASAGAAALGLARGSRGWSAAAVAIGMAGIVLYDFAWSGLGLLVGALVLTRRSYERPQHGER